MSQSLAIPTEMVPTSLPSMNEWKTMVDMAALLVPTGFLPQSINTPQKAVAIILKGQELRVPAMYALSNIVVVQGKPTCSAELMLALVYRDHGDDAVVVEESTPEVCRVSYRRRTWDKARTFAFSIGDAKTAGLAGKGTWSQYPQAMLRARCISAVARMAFPDSIAGMYTPEEMGAAVQVGEDGTINHVDVQEELPPKAPRARVVNDWQDIPDPNGAIQQEAEAIITRAEQGQASFDALKESPEDVLPDDHQLIQQARTVYRQAQAAGYEPDTPSDKKRATVTAWIASWQDAIAPKPNEAPPVDDYRIDP